jgi:hypothetical protein
MHVISAVLDVAVSIRFFRIPVPFFVYSGKTLSLSSDADYCRHILSRRRFKKRHGEEQALSGLWMINPGSA